MFLATERIGFRPIERQDLVKMAEWRNSPDIRKRCREFAPLNMINQERWLESLDKRENIMFAIEDIENAGGIIGVCGITHIDWKNRSGELSWYLGEEKHRGEGLGRHIIFLLCEYVFKELGLHRFWGEVYVTDDEILKMYRKLGFVVEAMTRDAYWYGGRFWPSAFVSILEDEWGSVLVGE